MSAIDTRLADLGITLPEPVAPVANYVPFVQSGSQVFISGQVSISADGLVKGTLGSDMDGFGAIWRFARLSKGSYSTKHLAVSRLGY